MNVAELLPHAPPMVLLDRVITHDETSLLAETTIKTSSMFFREAQDPLCEGEAGVPSWVGVEYLAQAVAAWAGLRNRRAGTETRSGFLVGVKEYQASRAIFPLGRRLRMSIIVKEGLGPLSVFEGRIETEGVTAQAVISVIQGAPPEPGPAGQDGER